MLIVGDPGHGSTENGVFDPGAVGNGLRECDLTLDIVRRAKDKLSAYEVDFRIAPQGSLAERVSFANDVCADFFLSVHVNAGGGTGFESYIWTFDYLDGTITDELQAIIHHAVMGYLGPQSLTDRGPKAANFEVLRETDMPALLLECLFIDNPWDSAKLKDNAFLNGLANEIAWGLVRAFNLQKKDPCANCQKVNELIIESGKIFAENTRLRQIISQVQGVLSSV
jgi:N-acetylmuramoyl-L-alanine amidase